MNNRLDTMTSRLSCSYALHMCCTCWNIHVRSLNHDRYLGHGGYLMLDCWIKSDTWMMLDHVRHLDQVSEGFHNVFNDKMNNSNMQ